MDPMGKHVPTYARFRKSDLEISGNGDIMGHYHPGNMGDLALKDFHIFH